MNKLLIATASIAYCCTAVAAGPECTTENQDSWMPVEEFSEQVKLLGYDTSTLNVSEGNCYTLTALDAASGDDLDYFNPMTGQVIEQ